MNMQALILLKVKVQETSPPCFRSLKEIVMSQRDAPKSSKATSGDRIMPITENGRFHEDALKLAPGKSGCPNHFFLFHAAH